MQAAETKKAEDIGILDEVFDVQSILVLDVIQIECFLRRFLLHI